MPIIRLDEYRRLLDRYGDRDVAMDLSSLTEAEAASMAANGEWSLHCARILYDAQARELRRYGLDPIPVLGVRP